LFDRPKPTVGCSANGRGIIIIIIIIRCRVAVLCWDGHEHFRNFGIILNITDELLNSIVRIGQNIADLVQRTRRSHNHTILA